MNVQVVISYIAKESTIYVTRPVLSMHYVSYLVFWICYLQSVSFTEFLIYFYIYDKMYSKIQNTIRKLLQFKPSKLHQILHVDKTAFLRPNHI